MAVRNKVAAANIPPRSPQLSRSKSVRESSGSDIGGWGGDGEEADVPTIRSSIENFNWNGISSSELPPPNLNMPRSKSLGTELTRNKEASVPEGPSSRPSSAQLRMAVARGMAAVADAGLDRGEPANRILQGMQIAGRLMAEQALSAAEGDEAEASDPQVKACAGRQRPFPIALCYRFP